MANQVHKVRGADGAAEVGVDDPVSPPQTAFADPVLIGIEEGAAQWPNDGLQPEQDRHQESRRGW
jgi:hypothetical protein